MPEEFWIVGIIKDYHKRVKDNLWVLVMDEKDAHHKLQRLSKVKDYSWISYRYDSRYKAELTLKNFLKKKFRCRYEFKILHYAEGRFLDDWIPEDYQQAK
jgi:hypothetical protein